MRRHPMRTVQSLNIGILQRLIPEFLISTNEDNEKNESPDVGEESVVGAVEEIADQPRNVEYCIKNPRLIIIRQQYWVLEGGHLWGEYVSWR